MDDDLLWAPALLAGVVGALISLVELITTYYARTFRLFLFNTWAVWALSAIYGLIAFGIMLGWNSLVHDGVVEASGFLAKSHWLRPILVGVCAKAFLHTRLFAVQVSGKPFPVGIETLVQLFEPWLLRTILLDEHSAIQFFLAGPLDRYTDLNQVKTTIRNNIPTAIPSEERETVLSDLDKKQTVRDAMAMYLRLYGPAIFRIAFPSVG